MEKNVIPTEKPTAASTDWQASSKRTNRTWDGEAHPLCLTVDKEEARGTEIILSELWSGNE